ncbi:MAG: exodeoxyribonuclease VII small subunit [Candidatus Paceibacterota bacterium]|nr:MAG: exodeoxyribonuclease VII small subunit [Candidatus Paceibacterota bacterium]
MSPSSKKKQSADKDSLATSLATLEEIVQWFSAQDTVDLEEALKKTRQGAELISSIRGRITDIENEFRDLEKEMQRPL